MNIDYSSLPGTILDAARATAGRRWRTIRPMVEMETRKLVQTIEDVERLLAAQTIDRERARQIVRVQYEAVRRILSTTRGFSLAAVSRIAQAATRAAGNVVNGVLGFDLMSVIDEPADSSAAVSQEPPDPALAVSPPQLSRKFKAGKDL